MEFTRWLAVYVDRHGNSRAVMIRPAEPADFPFGVDVRALDLPDFAAVRTVTLVEMPADAEFRPTIVDTDIDEEVPLHFIDL